MAEDRARLVDFFVFFDGVFFDGVFFDGVFFDGVFFDGVFFDGVFDGVFEAFFVALALDGRRRRGAFVPTAVASGSVFLADFLADFLAVFFARFFAGFFVERLAGFFFVVFDRLVRRVAIDDLYRAWGRVSTAPRD